MQLELVTNLHEVCSCIITEVLIICPGSPAECDYPLCCSPGQARAGAGAGAGAGRWGEYTCDTPPWTLEATLAHIRDTQPDLDLVLVTGDLPAHDIWRQSRASNLHTIRIVAEALHKYFPDTPVLPAIGNHEGFPVNMFPGLTSMIISYLG